MTGLVGIGVWVGANARFVGYVCPVWLSSCNRYSESVGMQAANPATAKQLTCQLQPTNTSSMEHSKLWDHRKAAGERIHPLKTQHPPSSMLGIYHTVPLPPRRYRARVFLQSRSGLTLRTMTMPAKGLLWRFTLLGRCLTNV